jgi:hypothetical protein
MTEMFERRLSDRLHAHPLPDELADLGMRSVRRGQRMRRRRFGAVVAVLVALIAIPGAAGWLGGSKADGPVTNNSTASPAAVPNNAGVEWGPDIPLATLSGVPYAGDKKWPMAGPIASLTVVEGGVVYVLPDRRIIFESWQHDSAVIGEAPWFDEDPFDFDPQGRGSWARGVVGDPAHDLVAWFETESGRRGDLVLVQASTGVELARTAVPGPAGVRAAIAAIGDEYVYFSAQSDEGRRASPEPDRRLVWMSSSWPLDDVWSWRWGSGAAPGDTGRQAQDVEDVSAEVWARTVEPKLRFETGSRKLLSSVGSYLMERGRGRGLSPDGRFWFAQWGLVVTETGERRSLGPDVFGKEMAVRNYAWTGTTKLTIVSDNGLTVCDAVAATCSAPIKLLSGMDVRPPVQ